MSFLIPSPTHDTSQNLFHSVLLVTNTHIVSRTDMLRIGRKRLRRDGRSYPALQFMTMPTTARKDTQNAVEEKFGTDICICYDDSGSTTATWNDNVATAVENCDKAYQTKPGSPNKPSAPMPKSAMRKVQCTSANGKDLHLAIKKRVHFQEG